jgi:ribosomal protein L34
LQDESGGRFLRARRRKGRMPSDVLAPAPIKSRASSSGILLIKCRRRHGRIALIASLARGSILSRTKVYYPAQATGLKQILLCIANSLR